MRYCAGVSLGAQVGADLSCSEKADTWRKSAGCRVNIRQPSVIAGLVYT